MQSNRLAVSFSFRLLICGITAFFTDTRSVEHICYLLFRTSFKRVRLGALFPLERGADWQMMDGTCNVPIC
jgi:hypothetical protein